MRGREMGSVIGSTGVVIAASGATRSTRRSSPARTTTRSRCWPGRTSAAPTVSAAGAPPGDEMLP
jgi:hypothetical protein